MDTSIGLGDCLDFDIPAANLIMTSPPYADRRKTTYGGIKPNDYVEWFKPYGEKFYETLADDGSMVINIKENVVDGTRHPYVYDLVRMLTQEQGWRLVDEYIWVKTTTTPGKWPNRFRDQWERLYHFTKNKKFAMYQDEVMVPAGDWKKTRMKNLSDKDKQRQSSSTGSGFSKNISNWKDRDMVYPSNVLTGSPVTYNVGHSAAYPLWLPEFFIKLFTKEEDMVVDPFAGSGTTLIAANKLGRNSYGIDNNPDSFSAMTHRLHGNEVDFQEIDIN